MRDLQQRSGSNSMRDRMRKAMEDKKNRGGGGRIFNLPEGKKFWSPSKELHTIDILPYMVTVDGHKVAKKGEMYYEKTYLRHQNIGSERKRYICPRTIGKKCPICEYRAELSSKGADKKILDDLVAKERNIYNVIDLEKEAEGIQFWDYSYHWFEKTLISELALGKEENYDFFYLEGGYSLRVKFKLGTYKNKPTFEARAIDFVERDTYNDKVLKDTVNLDETLIVLPYEELKQIFFETGEELDKEPEEAEPEDHLFDADRERHATRPATVTESYRSRPTKVTEEEPELPRRRRPIAPETEKNPCPHGHEFGVDTDKKDDCAECGDEWQGCFDKKEELVKAARTSKR